MRKIFGVISAIVLALAVTAAQDKSAPQPADAAEKILIANEHALLESVVKADKASFLSLTLPEGIWTTRQGFVPMKLLVDGLHAFHVSTWDIVNPRVSWLDKDSALLSYAWTGTGTYGDQPLASTTVAITAWTRRDGKWLAAHHQETDVIKD
jgi:hypothetical protein